MDKHDSPELELPATQPPEAILSEALSPDSGELLMPLTASADYVPNDEAAPAVYTAPAAIAPIPFWTAERVIDILLILAIIAACALRVWDVFAHNPMDHIFSDAQRHWDHAKEPLTPAPMMMFDAPLYQMWLSVVQKWSLGLPELIALYAAALSVITPWLWYRCLRELLDSRRVARYGWLLFAILPSWISIYSYFMSETLLLALMGGALWQTCRAKRKQTLGAFVWMVVIWTLAGMTRGIAVPLAGIAGFWVWWSSPRKIVTALCSVLIAAAMLGPIAWRNHQLIGVWAPFGNGYLNEIYAGSEHQNIRLNLQKDGAIWVYEFGSPSLYQDQLQPLSDWRSSRNGMAIANIDLRNGAADWKADVERNAVHGMRAVQLRAENVLLVMAGESWPDNNAEYFTARASIGTRWIWAPLMVLLLGLGLWRWRDIVAKPLVPALIVTWFCFQAVSLISVNEGRYRKPLEGLLIVQALLMWQAMQRKVRPEDRDEGDKRDAEPTTLVAQDKALSSEGLAHA